MARKAKEQKEESKEKSNRAFFRKEFAIDIQKEYKLLKEVGRVPANKLTDRVALLEAINASGENATKAQMIFGKARKERELFRITKDAKMRHLKMLATARVKSWLESSGIKKQITIDMVIEEICSHGDTRKDYEEIITEELELKEIKDNCEALQKAWFSRMIQLTSQGKMQSAKREVNLNTGGRKDRNWTDEDKDD